MSVAIMLPLVALFVICTVGLGSGHSRDKAHPHKGKLEPFDGKHIGYELTAEQTKKLNSGHAVTLKEKSGKHGRGIVLQDVEAPPEVCMNQIKDLAAYPGKVPKVRKVELYDIQEPGNGEEAYSAEIEVNVFPLTFGYFLVLRFDRDYNTFRWTLDYQFSSDFDDNIGQWQVMPHPTKSGWSRVLYSCQAILLPWIPDFVVNYLTNVALVESTTWVKKEAEKIAVAAARESGDTVASSVSMPDLSSCFVENEDGTSRYVTHCIETAVGAGARKRDGGNSGSSIGGAHVEL